MLEEIDDESTYSVLGLGDHFVNGIPFLELEFYRKGFVKHTRY